MRLLALAFLISAPRAEAVEWSPFLDSQVLLGQIFTSGQASAWQGNANAQFTPAAKLSESMAVIPTYYGAFEGTKSVVELGGGGQLFQQSMTHSLSAKLVYKTGRLKLKPSAGYRWEFLRETTDESWGGGLFDYRKPSGGLEAEYEFPSAKTLVSGAFDYYAIDFPNYQSLDTQVSGALGREQAGALTLNTRNYSWTTGAEFPLGLAGASGKVALNFTDRYYPQQHIVDVTGSLTGDLRSDSIKSAATTLIYAHAFPGRVAGLFSCAVSYARYDSNQSHYDAELNVFDLDYYSYEERSVQPKIALQLGERKVALAVSYLRIDRGYMHRLAQSASGTNTDATIWLAQDSFLLDVGVPLGYGFKLIGRSAFTNSSSNNLYEKTFKYNYTLSSHLLGFSYSL